VRALVKTWLGQGLRTVAPEPLTQRALAGREGPVSIIAIGKAAPGMCRGAADAVTGARGICITDREESLPDGFELLVGDHPVPGERSLRAGLRALDFSQDADIALISGGGSALCEAPIDGVDISFVGRVSERLLGQGIDIETMNLVRRHLSKVKSGGLGPLPTYVISDVSGHPPDVVSSGPTIAGPSDPERAISVLRRLDVGLTEAIETAIRQAAPTRTPPPRIEILADGHTAAEGVTVAARHSGIDGHVSGNWIEGPIADCLSAFLDGAGPGLTVIAGEPDVTVTGRGRGGRNTHAALMAATMIQGTNWVFAALATDGVDGASAAAGAIVDGSSIARGGEPQRALDDFDSATYLEGAGDLIVTGPTGTNVADLWLVWKPAPRSQPILAP
jgi:glycerate 2-kinase